jgi:type I restriction enzyme S subunit
MNKVLLIDIGKSQTGPFGSQLHEEDYVEIGTPIVTVEHLGEIGFTHQNLPFVSDFDTDRLSKYKLIKGDIVFSRVGSVDRSTYVSAEEEGWLFSGRCIRVRINETKANPRFVSYYFKQRNFKEMMKNISVGATMPSLNTSLMDNIPLILPELIFQSHIAKVLSDLDAKIELNNKINAELEDMAKLIYDYWFVQFEFPVCNEDVTLSAAEGYKSSGGKMVWNEELKREVPEGWEVKKLSEIANITMGQSPPGESYNEEKIGTIFYQGCTDFGKRFPTIRKYTTQPTRFAQISDILLSVRAPVGSMNIAKEECCIGRGLAALNSKNDCMPYLFGVMSNLKQIFDRRNTDGTTFGAITKDDLFSIKVISPSDELIKEFDKIVGPMFSQQNTNEFQNNELAELRDWLLPMLMNGQVRVEKYNESEGNLNMAAEEREKYI